MILPTELEPDLLPCARAGLVLDGSAPGAPPAPEPMMRPVSPSKVRRIGVSSGGMCWAARYSAGSPLSGELPIEVLYRGESIARDKEHRIVQAIRQHLLVDDSDLITMILQLIQTDEHNTAAKNANDASSSDGGGGVPVRRKKSTSSVSHNGWVVELSECGDAGDCAASWPPNVCNYRRRKHLLRLKIGDRGIISVWRQSKTNFMGVC